MFFSMLRSSALLLTGIALALGLAGAAPAGVAEAAPAHTPARTQAPPYAGTDFAVCDPLRPRGRHPHREARHLRRGHGHGHGHGHGCGRGQGDGHGRRASPVPPPPPCGPLACPAPGRPLWPPCPL